MYDFYPAEWGPARNRSEDDSRDDDRDQPDDN